MLLRLQELEKSRFNFAFETTLASRSFAPRLKSLIDVGYTVHLLFLYLPSVAVAIERVEGRVLSGGHSVDPAVIRRRYVAGLRNFFQLYQPLTHDWWFYDASADPRPRIIARQTMDGRTIVKDPRTWDAVRKEHGSEKKPKDNVG